MSQLGPCHVCLFCAGAAGPDPAAGGRNKGCAAGGRPGAEVSLWKSLCGARAVVQQIRMPK